MNPRTIRRAAERKAAKQARKAAVQNPSPTTHQAPTVSPAQLAANQANAKLSTGPQTAAGKQTSSLNALKTALTGQTVLLPTDDVAAYQALTDKFIAEFQPLTGDENTLVQSIIDTTWRLYRIPNLENAIYAKGSLEFDGQFEDLDPAARSQMIQLETYLKYEKSIRNLNTQEARLQRRLVKDTAELARIQTERRKQQAELEAFLASQTRRSQSAAPSTPAPTEFGFDFSELPTAVPSLTETAPETVGIATLAA